MFKYFLRTDFTDIQNTQDIQKFPNLNDIQSSSNRCTIEKLSRGGFERPSLRTAMTGKGLVVRFQ